jgi:hypothetical protein
MLWQVLDSMAVRAEEMMHLEYFERIMVKEGADRLLFIIIKIHQLC